MKIFALIMAIICALASFYSVIKGDTLYAIYWMTLAIYNKQDTKE